MNGLTLLQHTSNVMCTHGHSGGAPQRLFLLAPFFLISISLVVRNTTKCVADCAYHAPLAADDTTPQLIDLAHAGLTQAYSLRTHFYCP